MNMLIPWGNSLYLNVVGKTFVSENNRVYFLFITGIAFELIRQACYITFCVVRRALSVKPFTET